jgi:hypothetical protein
MGTNGPAYCCRISDGRETVLKRRRFQAVAEELRVKGLTQNEAATKDIPLPIKRPLASGSALTKSLPNFSAKRAKLVKRPREFKAETSPEPKMEPGENFFSTPSPTIIDI